MSVMAVGRVWTTSLQMKYIILPHITLHERILHQNHYDRITLMNK